ncbi:amino acid adenylation domain-containing protein [Oceanirhabdus sp. W0125-5]|uniref:amino acid adenylation domain-containing protein n=1 Tax=Oceanirhabdus sp. W0125-5 TaxID=2999116 RepID=UPI0022F2D0A1|nr:amino acid adenylation domain-containing protein [Oceanirhabdus sp. W0125-5]WBW96384.1 amino acid adenylation domain-containing protein [Oceanirhabdus sp. W0125-5]
MYYNLSHPQKRIWYIEKINTGSNFHNLGGCLKISGDIDYKILEDTINRVIQINDGLRIRFTEKDGIPYQYVSDYKKERIDVLDFNIVKNSQEKFNAWTEEVFKKRFQIEDSQLYYFAIFKTNEKEGGILLNIHHIIADGWSINIIQNQICEIYNDLVNGNNPNCSNEYSYMDYIEREKKYLESDRFKKNKEFWNDKFSDLPESFLYDGGSNLDGKRKTYNVDKELSYKIKRFIKEEGCSLNTLFISSMLIYLNKMTQEDDIVIGTPVLNRSGKKEKNTVGMYTSTMPFRINIDENMTIEEFIDTVNSQLKACFYNQKYPYDILVNDLELAKKGYDGLFKMCVNYYNSKNNNKINGLPVQLEEYYCGNQSYSLQLIIKEWDNDERITLSFDYKTSEYSSDYISNMYKYMMNIACEILNNKDERIKNLGLLDDEEINERVYNFNSTKSEYPKDKTVNQLFEQQVRETPDKIAVIFGNENLTYRELNKRVNQMAQYLRKNHVAKGSIVGIMANHSIELVIGILGVMRAGGAYIPIDPAYPTERIMYMLEDSGTSLLLTNISISTHVRFQGKILDLNNYEIYIDNSEKNENLGLVASPEDLAYIIYTSGSTGKPKGVMIEQRGLVNYIWWAKKMYLKDKDDIFALYSSISFDLTVTSIFTPLISGNTICIYHDDGNEFILYKILKDNKVTVVKLTPSHLTLLKDMDNSESIIRRFIVGGENLKSSLAKEIYESFNSNIEILNEYGPTETVVGCMIHEYNPLTDTNASVPIGIPADNVQIYLLDKNLKAIPEGAIGEMYVSGDGVARGYLNREELTEERFINNPFVEEARMYKTGDKGRYLKNGIIEYAGRSDNQVKIRGHRIELGEIEEYLLENEYIDEALVIDKKNKNGDKVLYAYLIGDNELDNSELKKWLVSFVPKYMIPVDFIYLKEFPLTPNGKVDIKKLPEGNQIEKEFISSRNDIEDSLVQVLQEILGVNEISMNDNFYQLGGDSIKAIQIASKLKNMGLEIKVKDILSQDAIEEIAASIEIISENIIIDQEVQSGNIMKTPITEWFFSQNFINENYYNQSVLLECKEKLNSVEIEKAMKKLIEHHDILRLNYNKDKKELFYNNEYLNNRIIIEEYNISQYSSNEQEGKIKEIGSKIKASFDIQKDVLIKVCIFNRGEVGQTILFTAHHLIVDGVSWRILLDDFGTVIEQIKANEEVKLPLKTHSFKEWSIKLNDYVNDINKNEKEYWNKEKEKKFTYPIDHDLGESSVKSSLTLERVIDEELTQELSLKVNEIYGMDLNEALIAALVMTIKELTGQEDIIIELERHGREVINEEIDVSRTIGWFTSMYPAIINVTQEEIQGNIKSIKEQLRNIPNKGFDFSILKYLKGEFTKYNNQQIRFNYLGEFDNIVNNNAFEILNLDSGNEVGEENHLTALIDINAMILHEKLSIKVTFSKNKFRNETIEEFIECYVEKIKEILNHCSSKDDKEYTPSDFVAVDISQEDLDMLLG